MEMLSLISPTVRSPEQCAAGNRSLEYMRLAAAAAVFSLGLVACGGSDSEPPPIQTPSPVAPIVTPPPHVTTVAAVVPRFAYAANATDVTISIYAVDAQSGQLRANGYAVAGVGVREVAVDPSNSFVYALVGVGTNAGVFVARIDAETGQLTPVAGSPFATGNAPEGIAVHPTGPYVYVTDSNSDSVFAYAIDSSSGAVTPVAGSPFAAGDYPKSVAVDPTGKFVYVTNKESANVSAFRIDAATGALTPIAGSPFVSGFNPNSVVVNSSGTVAYVVNGGRVHFYEHYFGVQHRSEHRRAHAHRIAPDRQWFVFRSRGDQPHR